MNGNLPTEPNTVLSVARAAAASPSLVADPPSAAGDGDTGPAREPMGSGKSPAAPSRSTPVPSPTIVVPNPAFVAAVERRAAQLCAAAEPHSAPPARHRADFCILHESEARRQLFDAYERGASA